MLLVTITGETMQAIIYVRVSTSDQADNGQSLDAQEAKARAWAELNGYDVGAVHVDAGLSGRRADNRPALQEALGNLSKDAALIVYSLSRLARSTRDAISIAEQIEKRGADLVSISEKIDTTTAAGKMVFRMLAVLAEFESDQISERTKLAMQHKKSKQEFTGGKRARYGFKRGDDGISLVPVESEQEVIALVKRYRSQGLTLRVISSELENAGILSRTERPFSPMQVKRIAQAA